jgi:hypothetical protein
MRLTSTGLGIGTTSPDPGGQGLHVHNASAADSSVRVTNSTTGATNTDGFAIQCKSDGTAALRQFENSSLTFETNAAERGRWDSSGRFLVGTSSQLGNGIIQAKANSDSSTGEGILLLAKGDGATAGQNLGQIKFTNSTGNQAAWITALADTGWGGSGSADYPGALTFATTADGASSPTEAMRITNGRDVFIGKTASGIGTVGSEFGAGALWVTRSAGTALRVNRLVDDGTLVEFLQASVAEGTISVSGTTVSYNGAHLSRWSQLPGGAERTEILRGTVLSNIDEMCDWGEEANEQLNRMKVSDVEGDPNVSGVFQAWDDDDDTYTDDFYCAMTGDFIIRIAEGVTVQRGDLLMSAGDGTAKPQGDDIIRSKTIAKVTSTHVACTYDDGSYCVPCVLMAC